MAKRSSKRNQFISQMNTNEYDEVAAPRTMTQTISRGTQKPNYDDVFDSMGDDDDFDNTEEEVKPSRPARQPKRQPKPTQKRESKQQVQEKRGGLFGGLFGGRKEEEQLDRREIASRSEAMVDPAEVDRIAAIMEGKQMPFEIIAAALEKDIATDDLVYLRYITDNDVRSYHDYVRATDENETRQEQRAQQEQEEREAEERARQEAIEAEERARQEKLAEEERIAQEKREKLLALRKKASEKKATQKKAKTIEGDGFDFGLIETSKTPPKDEADDTDFNFEQTGEHTFEPVQEDVPSVWDNDDEEEYQLADPDEQPQAHYQEDDYEDTHEEKTDSASIYEYNTREVFIVGSLREVLKNSGVGEKTTIGYNLTHEMMQDYVESLEGYHIRMIEHPSDFDEYLRSKSNLLIITDDLDPKLETRLKNILQSVRGKNGFKTLLRIVTIKGATTEVLIDDVVERSIKLTQEDLDKYFEENETDKYVSEKQGFSALDELLN